jgi:hypothetical protein
MLETLQTSKNPGRMTTSNVSTPHTSQHPKYLTSKSVLTFQNIHRGHFIGRIDTIILPLANTHRLGVQHGQSTVNPQSIDRFLDPPLSTTVSTYMYLMRDFMKYDRVTGLSRGALLP